MIILDIALDGTPSETKLKLGNKYENNDEIIQFNTPDIFSDYNKYLIAILGNGTSKITRILPLTNDQIKVSSSLTYHPGTWTMYLMFREYKLDVFRNPVDISARSGEHVWFSDPFEGNVKDTLIEASNLISEPLDANIQIVYDDLIKLRTTVQNDLNSGNFIGSSAYEVAVKNGFTGTEEEWIASLVGKTGPNGSSAYEVAVKNGFTGTEEEWIASLVGKTGPNGSSAYEVAVKNGFTGTEEEWIASLVGKTGPNGSSAYEVAVKNGFTGTEEEWIASLVGKTGPNGSSAYEVAVKNGFTGTEEEWIASMSTQEELDALAKQIQATHNDLDIAELDIRNKISELRLDIPNEILEKYLLLQRTGKVYTVKFPLWDTSHSSTGEKMDANAGLVCEPSTNLIKGRDDYENIGLFKTYDVNAYVDENGVRHVTAIKGDKKFKDVGENDVFVMGMSYYEKTWISDGYWYYSRTDLPREGYTIARECENKDKSTQPFALYSKYVSGEINNKPYSSKGLKPKRSYPSYMTNIDYYKKRGIYYTGGSMCDYKYILTTFWLKYGTINSDTVMRGCTSYDAQCAVARPETDTTRVMLASTNAGYFPIGAFVSVGDAGSYTELDRSNSYMHNIADDVEILSKEIIDESTTALVLDVKSPFTTTPTTYVTSMHYRSGVSDKILGRDGCLNSLTDGKSPMVIQGIELAVGGYEVASNVFMDIADVNVRDVYITNDATKLIKDIGIAKSTYTKAASQMVITTLNNWNYITETSIDLKNGIIINTKSGGTGSGSSTGYGDGIYVDSSNSGQREFLLLGSLRTGAVGGLSCVHGYFSLANADWYILSRLSINCVG